MVDKCLGAAKPSIKTKAMECMLLFFEVSENFGEETLDAFQAVLKSNKPKVRVQVSLTLNYSTSLLLIYCLFIDCINSVNTFGGPHEGVWAEEIQPSAFWSIDPGRSQFFSACRS